MILKTVVIYLLVVLGFGLTAATAMMLMEVHDEIERRRRDEE